MSDGNSNETSNASIGDAVTSGLSRIEVHYRTDAIPYRLNLQDLYLVPAVTQLQTVVGTSSASVGQGAPSPSSSVPSSPTSLDATTATSPASANTAQVTQSPLLVTLTSPLLRGGMLRRGRDGRLATNGATTPLPAAELRFEMHDLHCPSCANTFHKSKRFPSSTKAAADAANSIATDEGAVPQQRSSTAALEPAAMLRCPQCIQCPQCNRGLLQRRAAAVISPSPTSSSSAATAAAAAASRDATVVYCNACLWKTPVLPLAEISTWLATCTHSVVRSACGYQALVTPLRQANAPLSLSSNARSALAQQTADGTLPFTAIREEKVMQFEAALQAEQRRLDRGSIVVGGAKAIGGGGSTSSRLSAASQQVGQSTAPRKVSELAAMFADSTTSLAPLPQPHVMLETSGVLSRDPTGLLLNDFGRRSILSGVLPVISHIDSTTNVVTTTNAGGVAESSAADGGGAIAKTQPLPIVAMSRSSLLARMNIVVASTATAATAATIASSAVAVPTSTTAAPVSTLGNNPVSETDVTALVSAIANACDASDGISGKFFTHAVSNPLLSTSVCAARYLPTLMLPANLSRFAKTDAKSTSLRKRVFAMLRLLNADEMSRVVVHSVMVMGTEGCTATTSTTTTSTEVEAAKAAETTGTAIETTSTPVLCTLRGASASNTSSKPATSSEPAPVKYYVDNRICDDVFPPDDTTAAPQPPAGIHVRHGSCIFGIDIKLDDVVGEEGALLGASGDAGCGPRQPSRCSVELEMRVTIYSSVLTNALRRAFTTSLLGGVEGTANRFSGVSVAYRSILTFVA